MTRKRRWSERSKYAPRVTVADELRSRSGAATYKDFINVSQVATDMWEWAPTDVHKAERFYLLAADVAESLALGNSPEDFDALMGGG